MAGLRSSKSFMRTSRPSCLRADARSRQAIRRHRCRAGPARLPSALAGGGRLRDVRRVGAETEAPGRRSPRRSHSRRELMSDARRSARIADALGGEPATRAGGTRPRCDLPSQASESADEAAVCGGAGDRCDARRRPRYDRRRCSSSWSSPRPGAGTALVRATGSAEWSIEPSRGRRRGGRLPGRRSRVPPAGAARGVAGAHRMTCWRRTQSVVICTATDVAGRQGGCARWPRRPGCAAMRTSRSATTRPVCASSRARRRCSPAGG